MVTGQKPPGQKPRGQKPPDNKPPWIIEEIIVKYDFSFDSAHPPVSYMYTFE